MRLAEDVAVRHFSDEAVVLNLASGQYHGLDSTGRAFLAALEDQGPVSAAVDSLEGSFDVAPERLTADMAEFVEALRARGLIEVEVGEGA